MRIFLVVGLVWAALGPCCIARATIVPAGFDDQPVAALDAPTAMAFTPDGRILIATQTGQLRVYKNGALLPTPALGLAALGVVCTNLERGLLGVAVDRGFADQHFVYLYYTFRKNGNCGTDAWNPSTQPVNRLSRFTLGDDDVIDPASEHVLLDNIPSPTGVHNAGDLKFGKDGYLYVSTGDGHCDYAMDSGCGPVNDAARDPSGLQGKVLRIGSDGEIPPDNPFTGPNTARCDTTGRAPAGTFCQETYASGLRNPFRMAFDANAAGTSFYVNDVGEDKWEEVDVGQAGADFGWNLREGPCSADSTTDCGPAPIGVTNPIYDYPHAGGCSAITGGAFVPTTLWPAEYDDGYLFGDLVCGKIWQLVSDGAGGHTANMFVSDAIGLIALEFGPYGGSQALYYLLYGDPTNPNTGQVRRIVYTGGANRSPTARTSANPTSGDLPLTVSFDGTASSDPDGNDLTYDWDFGDGSEHGTDDTTSHMYSTAGIYTAKLRVNDGSGGESTTSIRIDTGNHPPVPTISTPAPGDRFSVGQDITLTGSATDPEDGSLPDSVLTWQVIKHHATHIHPFLPATPGNGVHITGPAPEDINATTNSYLEIRLTATDSHGLATTVTQDLRPRQVDLTFDTDPTGLALTVDGSPATAPKTITSWEGWRFPISAADQRDSSDQGQTFATWSDGGAPSHEITTPADPTSYVATFTKYYARPRGATPMRLALVPAYSRCVSPNREHSAPLQTGACDPPRQSSDYLTVGTGDANGATANSVGSARIRVVVDNPSTPQDESDVRLRASITDVRSSTTLLDYAGQLEALVDIRVTDRRNGASGTDSGTTVDSALRFTLDCADTAGTTIGSTCSVDTSADALAPGMAKAGDRANWQLGQFLLYDGGADGIASTSPNTLFADAGLFVP